MWIVDLLCFSVIVWAGYFFVTRVRKGRGGGHVWQDRVGRRRRILERLKLPR